MALLIVRTDDGRSALIHSSQIGPQLAKQQETRLKREAAWADVWRRADQRRTGGIDQ